jgi:hypothetical protein
LLADGFPFGSSGYVLITTTQVVLSSNKKSTPNQPLNIKAADSNRYSIDYYNDYYCRYYAADGKNVNCQIRISRFPRRQ